MLAVLSEDVTACTEALAASDTPIVRRQYVRSVIALIEGLTSVLQRCILEHPEASTILTEGERAILAGGYSYWIAENGAVKRRQTSSPLRNAVLFTFDAYSRVSGLTVPLLDRSSSEWSLFQDLVAIRHRVTHPQHPSDLAIQNDEVANVRRAAEWMINMFAQLFVRSHQANYERLRGLMDTVATEIAALPDTAKGEMSDTQRQEIADFYGRLSLVRQGIVARIASLGDQIRLLERELE